MGLRGCAALTLASTQHSAELRKRRPSSTFPDCGPDSRSLRLRSDSAHEVTPPLDGPAHWVQGGCRPPGWLLRSEPRGRAGRGLRGAELVARRAAPLPLSGNGCSAALRAPGGGESARLAALWPRPGPGRKAGPPRSSLAGAGLSPERRNGVGCKLPAWFLGGGRRRRNMALVGNGAELEADEVLAGGE